LPKIEPPDGSDRLPTQIRLKAYVSTVVQKLSSMQRPEMLRHLQTLSAEDRRLRFGSYMLDAALENYVSHIDFAHDKVFGIFGHDMALLGMAHLALDRNHHYAELGLSVVPAHRGNGYGLLLLNRGKLSAVTRGYTTLFMHCLSENKIMIHLARKAGLKLVAEQGEVDAHLELESTSHAAVVREALEDQIALADLMFKQQFKWLFKRPSAA
jgi:RimJ/RimL family protein N-acetyltransferase